MLAASGDQKKLGPPQRLDDELPATGFFSQLPMLHKMASILKKPVKVALIQLASGKNVVVYFVNVP